MSDLDDDRVIVLTYQWYGHPYETQRLATTDHGGCVFDTEAEAEQWIEDFYAEVYRLAHNEAGRPSPKIIPAKSAKAVKMMREEGWN